MRIAVVAVGTRGDVEPHAALCMGLERAGYEPRLCAPNDFADCLVERVQVSEVFVGRVKRPNG